MRRSRQLGFVALSAVGVIGYAIRDEELIWWATTEFKRQIRDELGDDGLWPESVHTYHYFPLGAFIHFAEAAWHAHVDLYHWEAKPGKSLALMFSAPLAYAYPDFRLPAINDGWFQAYVPVDYHRIGRVPQPKSAIRLRPGSRLPCTRVRWWNGSHRDDAAEAGTLCVFVW